MSTLYNWSFAERLKCSEDERRHCLALVTEMIELAARARRSGLLSLVDTIEGDKHFLLVKGLHLIVDGVKPDIVRRILENYILSDNCRGQELLIRCLILEGIAGIQSGANPKNIKEMLLSFFGSDGPAMYAQVYKTEDDSNLQDLLRDLDAEPDSRAPATSLNSTLSALVDADIQECLKEVSTQDLAMAVQGMGGRDQLRIFKNLSQRGAAYLQQVLTQMEPIPNSDMIAAQEKIESVISELESRGTIGEKKQAELSARLKQPDTH